MAKLPWYLKEDGKPYYKDGKLYQQFKIHWAHFLYSKVKYYIEICVDNEY